MKALTGGAATLYQYTTVSNRRSTRRTHCKHKPLGVLRANNVVDTSEDDPATTGSPEPFWPTRVRVQHDSYLRANRAAMWQLMQDVTPDIEWSGISVVLATLESIYGVEYQGLAGQLLTAFQEANLGLRLGETPSAHPTNSRSNSRIGQQQQQGHRQQEQERQYEHLGVSVLGLNLDAVAAVRRRTRKSRRSSPENSVDGSGQPDGQQHQQQQQEQGHQSGASEAPGSSSSSSSSSSKPGSPAAESAAAGMATVDDEEQEAAAAADAVFLQLLLLLAQRAGFVPLAERDVQLSVSLNTDFLWQLFVKANTEQLDDQFITSNLNINGSSLGVGKGTAIQLPEQTQSLLVLRRGYSSEKQRGRWLLQKLDYLQLLLVKRLLLGITSLGAAAWTQLRPHKGSSKGSADMWDLQPTEAAREIANSCSDRPEVVQQQQQQQAVQEDASEQLTGVAAALAAVAGRHQKPSSSNRRQQKQIKQQRPRTDAFGRLYLYPEPEQDIEADTIEADVGGTNSSSSSSTQDNSHSHSSRHRRKGSEGGSTQLPQPPGTSMAAMGSSSSSSSKPSQSQLKQQREQWRQQLRARRQQVQQEQQRRQQRVLADLKSGVQNRFMTVAHALSNWGIIPRMDVIPLERFDEVFPLREPSRLKPLFIEKATLPDIMDPVIEPRLKWLGPSGQSVNPTKPPGQPLNPYTALTAADGVSSSSIDSYDAMDLSTTPGAAASNNMGLFDALLQPVEIVEPTFRQLLVVYRKKPRRDRWRELRERITGKKTPQAAVRRSAIQLQVYRDIPLPSWQVVFPDKLLQFRPLDLLRLDLFGLAGIGAALVQAKYTSIILQLLTLASLSVWIFRITLGYLRMGDRYKTIIAQLLAERTVAGGEGGLEYLATAAGLQQFKQAALVYVLLSGSERAMTADEVAEAAEKLLEEQLQLQVCFNAHEALQELLRFGLLVVEQQQQHQSTYHAVDGNAAEAPEWQPQQHRLKSSVADGSAKEAATIATIASKTIQGASPLAGTTQGFSEGKGLADTMVQQQQQQASYRVVDSDAAQQVLQQYWAGLLQQRVNSILRSV